MTTLSEIAKEVFDALTVELEGVVKDITVTRKGRDPVYDPVTGKYPPAVDLVTTGRGLNESERPVSAFAADFPNYILTGSEILWFVAELSFMPQASDKFTVDGKTYEIKAVRDILSTGELVRVLVV